MKVSIITTVNHNVGDDFVREGILFLLKQKLKSIEIHVQNIHKHSPITTRYGFEKMRSYRISSRVDKLLPLYLTRDRVLEADLLVQSGAPVYWSHENGPHCADTEWFDPLIRRRWRKVRERVPFINLAAGSCQRYDSNGSEFLQNQRDIDYIKELFFDCSITTLRDKLAGEILRSIGLDAPVIPCSSIFAIDNLNIKPEETEFIALNYMRGGAHFTFGQNIDEDKWELTFKEFYNAIKNDENCVFVCHNQTEVDNAKKIASDAKIFYSENYIDYIKFYSKVKFGVLNRVHGAFMLGSLGRPSFVIGNDSRARMAEEIGLRHEFVNNVDLDRLVEEYNYLKKGADGFSERFHKIKNKAFEDYQIALTKLENYFN